MGMSAAMLAVSAYSAYNANENANDMEEIASQKNTDPWAASGGRALADRQLQLLMTDPQEAMQADPGYKSALMAAQRTMAKYGQDSGNMAVAAATTGSNWYDNAVRRLSGLAGAGQLPAQGASASLQGMQAASNLQGQGLASLGYGMRGLGSIFSGGGGGSTINDGGGFGGF